MYVPTARRLFLTTTAEGVLAAENIWKENLNQTVPGLTALVKKDLDLIQEKGMLEAVKTIL